MADSQPANHPDPDDAPRVGRIAALLGGVRQRLAALFAWSRAHKKLSALAVAGILLLFTTAGSVACVVYAYRRSAERAISMAAALDKLDAGEYARARKIAQRLQKSDRLTYDDLGGPPFVIGAAIVYEAEAAWKKDEQKQLHALAARYLETASDYGFPDGRQEEGLLLLAQSLQEIGRYDRSLPFLQELDRPGSPYRSETQRLLAGAYLHATRPDFKRALAHVDAFLKSPQLSRRHYQRGLLLKSEIHLARGEREACLAALDQIPDASPLAAPALLMQGRLLLEQASAPMRQDDAPDGESSEADLQKRFRPAIDKLRQAQRRDTLDAEVTSDAAYLIGVALRRSGQLRAAHQQFMRTRKVRFEHPAGLVACLEEAEVLARLGKPKQAAAAYERTLGRAGSGLDFENRWIRRDDLRERTEEGYQTLLQNHHYDLAVALSRALTPLFEKDRATKLLAEAHLAWGEHLLHLAAGAPHHGQSEERAAARRQFRLAGAAYARLARLHFTSGQYTIDLWKAGQSFSRGRNYERAVQLYREYLEYEGRQHRPLVLVGLGEALLSLDQVDEAISAMESCIRDYPTNPATYDARLLASHGYVEKGEMDRAKALLEENLHQESLTPRSDVWRDSLFALGQVLHDEGRLLMTRHDLGQTAANEDDPQQPKENPLELAQLRFNSAVRHLTEAVLRYGDDPQATMAQYLIAESHRNAAGLPMHKLETETIESRRAVLNQQVNQELGAALAAYDELVARLNQRPDGNLSKLEDAILRNAYFARGAALYDMGDYEEAIKAYSTATNRYQHEPAAVEAYVQIAACYRRLNKPLEARGTLEQAKLVMQRIRDDANFTATTRYGRDEWNTLLDWLSAL